ncbi:Protein of unknown function, partial [Gryllus bimaculatus]
MVELNILAENLIKIEEVKDEPVEINEEYSWSLNNPPAECTETSDVASLEQEKGIRSQDGEMNNFECSACKKVFTQKRTLFKHMRMHSSQN